MKHINSNELTENGEFQCPVCDEWCEWGDQGCPACGEPFSHHHVGDLEAAREFVQHRCRPAGPGDLDVTVCPIHGPKAILRQLSPNEESQKWCPQCGLELEIVDDPEPNEKGELLSQIGLVATELRDLGYEDVSEEADGLYQAFGTILVREQVNDDD